MRKIIVFNIISLDGYHTGPGNDVSVMFPMMGGVFDTYTAERLRAADTTIVGRVSFQGRALYMIELRFRCDAALRESVQPGPDR